MALELSAVLADPARAADDLDRDGNVFGVRSAEGRSTRSGTAILEMALDPFPALAAESYPAERIRIAILRDERAFAYVLSGPERSFKHRNPAPHRSLCLQYDADDEALKWLPEDGLEELVTLVHKHVIFEEYNRRHGLWPGEDAPHGLAGTGIHPVLTAQMRQLRRQWMR
jgi:hypothetical protein